MISYSQNCEDVILSRIFKEKIKGFCVDIGACHPVHDSVTKHFYELGWRGINIEPQPEMFELLRKDRGHDINLQAAITDRSSEVVLYIPESRANSNCSEEVAKTYLNHGEVLDKVVVKTLSLNELWSVYVGDKQVDFLKIDVEGLEVEILKLADLGIVNPSILVLWTEEDKNRQLHKAVEQNKELISRIRADTRNMERERKAFEDKVIGLENAYHELLEKQRSWERSLLGRLYEKIFN